MTGFTANFTIKDVVDDFKALTDQIENDALESAKKTLTGLVDNARRKANFNNITWDLRGSIGGLVVHQHNIAFRYFPPIEKGDGIKTGLAYVEEIANLVDDGEITVVFVAGMDYARFVEAKGKDVITGSSLKFEELFYSVLPK